MPDEQLEQAPQEPGQPDGNEAATPETQPEVSPELTEEALANMSDEEFEKTFEQLESGESAEETEPDQEPDKGDEAPDKDKGEAEPKGEEPAKKEPEAGEGEQKPEGDDQQATPADKLMAEVEALRADVARAKEAEDALRQMREDPYEFAKRNPDLIEKFNQRQSEEQLRTAPPQWTQLHPDQLLVQGGPYHGWQIGQLRDQDPDEYARLRADAIGMQQREIGRWEASRQADASYSTRTQAERIQQGWNAYKGEFEAANPGGDFNAHMAGVNEWLSGYLAEHGTMRPQDIVKLRDFDTLIKQAREEGEKAGREAVMADLNRAGSAPESFAGSKQGDSSDDPELQQFLAMDEAGQVKFMGNLGDAAFEKFNEKLRKAGLAVPE